MTMKHPNSHLHLGLARGFQMTKAQYDAIHGAVDGESKATPSKGPTVDDVMADRLRMIFAAGPVPATKEAVQLTDVRTPDGKCKSIDKDGNEYAWSKANGRWVPRPDDCQWNEAMGAWQVKATEDEWLRPWTVVQPSPEQVQEAKADWAAHEERVRLVTYGQPTQACPPEVQALIEEMAEADFMAWASGDYQPTPEPEPQRSSLSQLINEQIKGRAADRERFDRSFTKPIIQAFYNMAKKQEAEPLDQYLAEVERKQLKWAEDQFSSVIEALKTGLSTTNPNGIRTKPVAFLPASWKPIVDEFTPWERTQAGLCGIDVTYSAALDSKAKG